VVHRQYANRINGVINQLQIQGLIVDHGLSLSLPFFNIAMLAAMIFTLLDPALPLTIDTGMSSKSGCFWTIFGDGFLFLSLVSHRATSFPKQ
jgi:hypothetical protein